MKCILDALGFINENIEYNKNVIINTLTQHSGTADMVIFGEAFLQGFYAMNFDVTHDEKLAITTDHIMINEIRDSAKQYGIGVSFGLIEKDGGCFYSSQITIDNTGSMIDFYRRGSPGWKEQMANEKYREGKGFHALHFMNQRVVIGLCGDLWFDEHINQIKRLKPDVIVWPVYTDYPCDQWNTSVKYEYAFQANKFCKKVLYVNSGCLDQEGQEFARGGAAFFENGRIRQEIPAGREALLCVEV